jgi:diguanylate cyclase (GGDEF)-like protein
LVYATGLVLRPSESYLRIQSNIIFNIPPLAALALSVIPIRRSRGRERIGWLCLAVVLVTWQTGDWLYSYYDLVRDSAAPFPGLADLAYYAGYAFFIAAVALLTFPAERLQDRRWLVDAAIVIVVAGTITWEYLVQPIADEGGGAFSALVGLGYPLMDLALLTVLVVTAYASRGKLSLLTAIFAVAVIFQVIVDGIYTYVATTTGYDNVGNPMELGWLAAYILLAVCFALPPQAANEASSLRTSLVGLAFPYAFGASLLALVTLSSATGQLRIELVAGTSAAIMLVVLRQFLTLRDNLGLLVHAANYDALTGLPNRRRFEEEVSRVLAQTRHRRTGGALLLLDVDDLKAVNDSRGHHAGDELLRMLAEALRAELPEEQKLARLTADEFCVLIPQARSHKAREIAKQILQLLRLRTFLIEGEPVRITSSIGIALLPEHGTTVHDLLTHADLAMYEAKAAGGNGSRIYDPLAGGQELSESRLRWKHRIGEALEKDRFVLYAQPIIDLRSGEVHEYELLIRMQDENGGLIPPAEFLDVAERFGLIYDIDRWVLRQAIRLVAEQRERGQQVRLAVNLSAKTFLRSDLVQMIEGQLNAAGVSGDSLILEVTETAAMDPNMEKVDKLISGLKRLGCRFALDDFGVGFANMRRLKHLQVDYLKIDGSFIRNLCADDVDRHLVEAIVEVARVLGKKTVAEFVQDAETLRALREIGVDYGQGYHLGRPAPVAMVLATRQVRESPAA